MAYSLLTHLEAHSTNGNGFTSGSLSTLGSDLLIAVIAYQGSPTFSDSDGNTWNSVGTYTDGVNTVDLQWSTPTTTSSGDTFIITGSATYAAITITVWSGSDTTGPFDQVNGYGPTPTVNSVQAGGLMINQDNELVINGLAWAGGGQTAVTIDGPNTISDQFDSFDGTHWFSAQAYWVQTTATGTNPTWTADPGAFGFMTAIIASFYSAATATANGNLLLVM